MQSRISRRGFGRLAAGAAALAGGVPAAHAQQIDLTVTHFGTGMYGVPFAVAREKGWFKEHAGLDVRGFITSAGGGTTVRNALASDIPYGEVALPAAIAAIQQGVDLTIVHAGVQSVADQVWVTRLQDTSIRGYRDLAGKKLGYSSPRSVTDMITAMMLDANGLTGKVEKKAAGAMGAGLTALREGAIDMFYMTEPVYSKEKDQYRRVWTSADIAPRCSQTVGIAKTDWLRKNPKVIRGIIEARRRGVEFVQKHPADAAPIMAREYKIEAVHARSAIENVLKEGVYWSDGRFDYEGMDVMLKGLQLVKAIPAGPFDWSRVVDESYLPDGLRRR